MDMIFGQLFLLAGNAPPKSTRPHSCMAVTQVCGRWRRVAYRCADMWRSIPVESKEWTEIALQQSRGHSITVRWLFSNARLNVDALACVLKEHFRLRELSLNLRAHYDDLDAIVNMINATLDAWDPSSSLETFVLEASNAMGESNLVSVPPTVRSVKLEGFYFPIRIFRGRNQLRRFEMNALQPWVSLDEMLVTLSDLRQLEYLHIGDDVLSDDTVVDESLRLPQVVFPDLKSLTIGGTVGTINAFVRNVGFPPSCELELLYQDIRGLEDVDEGEVEFLAASLRILYSSAIEAASSFQTLVIENMHDTFGVWLRINASEPVPSPQLPARLCLDVMSPESPPAFTSQLLSSVPLIGGVKTITLVGVPFLGSQEWQRIGPAMADVESLLLKCEAGAARGIYEALQAALCSTPAVFPKLRNVVVMLRGDSALELPEDLQRPEGSQVTVAVEIWLSGPPDSETDQDWRPMEVG
ncbi:hypothetical protein BV25DRAFT_1427549 [Artomyces pyxidatus]|uniref:Uncharacterized protein n=1 Tax=Artomyces pyxidatus TaxID=48021 RepID=A0ACB8SLX1_9AGAM|nr:hypothetical protein BV25DRAFT_1427549 [Artomyces pyxidatus]